MYRSLTITGFRRFRQLEIDQLQRVNLLVGRNNSGKSSLLEAISVLAAPSSLANLLIKRDEVIPTGQEEGTLSYRGRELDFSYLFHGYSPEVGFDLSANGDKNHRATAKVIHEDGSPSKLFLDCGVEFKVPLTPQGGVRQGEFLEAFERFPLRDAPLEMLGPEGLSSTRFVNSLGKILLTPDERLLLDAMRLVDPTIQRIATLPVGPHRDTSPKYGVQVLCEGKPRAPLGNLGDGAWRLLMIATLLVQVPGGILLIDEIDTGLHHTVLPKMWRLVVETAKRLRVQVFATTHSSDCWKALARYLEESPQSSDEVSLQRLEAGREQAVAFPGSRLRIAYEEDIEVR